MVATALTCAPNPQPFDDLTEAKPVQEHDAAPDNVREMYDTQTQAVTVPTGFHLKTDGLYWGNDSPPTLKVCAPLNVVAETRNPNGEGWGLLIEWFDRDGTLHRQVLPKSMLAGDAAAVRERLLDGGLEIAPSKQARDRLSEFLMAVRTAARARTVDKAGWFGTTYLTPTKTYGPPGAELVVYMNSGRQDDRALR